MSGFDLLPTEIKPHPYQKLGGWLLFFVLISLVPSPYGAFNIVRGLVRFSYAPNPESVLFLLIQAVTIINWGFNLAANIMIIQRKHRFLRVRQIGLFITTLQMLLAYANNVVTAADEGTALITAMMLIAMIPIIPIMVYLLMLYYFRSVRVRTYMGSDEYLRLAFFTKKIKGPEPAAPDAADNTL